MLKQGILQPAEYLMLLRKRGYSIEWSSNLLESNGPGSTTNEPRAEGRLYADAGYYDNLYGVDEWQDRMEAAGYPPQWIQYYMSRLSGNVWDTVEDEDADSDTERQGTNGNSPEEDAEGISKPVSYTHLRAHETKANLVCRLLL